MIAPVLNARVENDGLITVRKRCIFCGFPASVTIPVDGYLRWTITGHRSIQKALPDLSDDEREVLLSGTHPDCFDRAYPDE